MKFLHCSNKADRSRADARRECLLRAARELFILKGFHATGMAQISAASGIAVGQIYRDFSSKEEIVAAIAALDLTAFLDEEGLDAAVGAGDAGAVRAWIRRLIRVGEREAEKNLMPEISAEAMRNERVAAIQRSIHARVRGNLLKALATLAPGAEQETQWRRLADLVMALAVGIAHQRIADPGGAQSLGEQAWGIVEREIDSLRPR